MSSASRPLPLAWTIGAVVAAGVALPACAANCRGGPLGQPTDVFLIAGQSNATGEPEVIGGSPAVPHGRVLKFERGEITDGDDPVGENSRGSAWPAFGLRYEAATGRAVLFVPASVPGSPLLAVASTWLVGFWDEGGGLLAASSSKADAALACAGPRARFAGVLWDQGEADAVAIVRGKETSEQYGQGLRRVIAAYQTHFGGRTPVYIFQTGFGGANEAGFAAVRAVQDQVAADMPQVLVAFRGAVTFPARGLMNADGIHYRQGGYNEMGEVGASSVVAGRASAAPR